MAKTAVVNKHRFKSNRRLCVFIVMRSTTKIAISADHCAFGVYLAFSMLQRRVFANRALDVHLLTTDADGEAKRTAEHVQNCGFSNLNEFNVTDDCRVAFRNADFLLLMTTSSLKPNAPERNFVENIENFTHVFEKAKLFNRWANSNARVLVMGLQTNTWLQIFGEVATKLPKHNFTGLSGHYASKALALIARKLKCEVRELSDVYVWGRNFLDVNSGKKQTTFAPTEEQRKYGLQCEYVAQNLIDLLPSSWIDNILTSQCTAADTRADWHSIVSSACRHLTDWCRGTGGRTVSMVTAVVPQPGGIDDGVYSSRPVVVDETGEIIAVNNVETDTSLSIKLYRFHENLQREKYAIRNFLRIMKTR